MKKSTWLLPLDEYGFPTRIVEGALYVEGISS